MEDIINPLIGLFFKADFSDVVIGLGGSSIKIGEFVNSIINFLTVSYTHLDVYKRQVSSTACTRPAQASALLICTMRLASFTSSTRI